MNITAITGSGISVASGIKTYREEGSGWDSYAHGIAHYMRYGNHLSELWRHWTAMAQAIETATPNAAHIALAEAGASIITQNVDGLHTRAGSENVVELHGNMYSMRCLRCKKTMPCDTSTVAPVCSYCGSSRIRTNAVLFGEPLLKRNISTAQNLVRDADLVVVVGTSGMVYPARGLVDKAIEQSRNSEQTIVLFDVAPWPDNPGFTDMILGPSSETLPEYLSGVKQ